jgi:O-antigen/teichoic acid export membrane protein
MHGWGAWLLGHAERLNAARIRWFFAMQGLLFPMGWLGFLVLPWTVRSIINGTFDREGMIDIPFIAVTAQPIWIATAMFIVAGSWLASAQATTPGESSAPELA